MTIPAPLVLIGAPLAMAVVLQLLRRWTMFMALLATLTTLFCGLLVSFPPLLDILSSGAWQIALEEPLSILGRVVVVEPADRLPLTFIFITAAILFVIAWRLLPHSNFFPVGLMMVAMLAGALMVKQVVYTALLVEMAAILAVFPLHEPVGAHYGRHTKGGARYIVYMTLALPGLMVTQLLLDLFAIFPNDTTYLQAATILLGLSFAILLGAVPFQTWLSTVATNGSPPVVTFLFTVNLGTVWFMLLAYLESYAWLVTQASFAPLFTTVGLLMMVIGGLLAASQRHLGRLVGYATLVDNGAMFVALGTWQVSGVTLAVMLLLARPLALGLMTMGLDGLRRLGSGDDAVETLAGAAWRAPWRTMAFVVGGIALAGFPLSLSFAAHWGLYRVLSAASVFQAVLALAGCAGVMMGVLGVGRVLLAPLPQNASREHSPEDPVVLILIVLLIGATLLSGIFPQSISRIVAEMATGFTFFTS
ncbi:MAG TPA: proton-conducting transporter membrane subunit [Anaerolineae bacterium]|mgnify:CR=1 FL=1|nr:proton-conducting transporter membrane subunit [Anaerolineae bacterium]HQH38315.1 proton-conducting transporter membrane subunit [Anaerolineae bacterium]